MSGGTLILGVDAYIQVTIDKIQIMSDLKMGGNASTKCEQFNKNHPMLPSQGENHGHTKNCKVMRLISGAQVFFMSDTSCRGESGYLVTFSLSLDITLDR